VNTDFDENHHKNFTPTKYVHLFVTKTDNIKLRQ